ncbi:hypothetical protein [uncultured Rhodoblastus sp.]|uniref:hypothetical protein n=1 Tax=uncultured Rhodoblastus sp. TaxID=543037 RepID=UPI0025D1B3AB|nr:hypothetical protein [uncultured Rhodoblastus sp.]
MSVLANVAAGLQSWVGASKDAGLFGADARIFDAAMAAIVRSAEAARAGTLTPVEALQTIDATLRAVAVVAPPVAQFESYVEAAEAVAELVSGLCILKMTPSNAPIFGGKIPDHAPFI